MSNGYEIIDVLDNVVDYAPCVVTAQRRVDGLTRTTRLSHTFRPVLVMEHAS